MKWIAMLSVFLMLTSCYRNGRDAIEAHQVIAEPSNRWVHWGQEDPINVTEDKKITSLKPCQQNI
jgi:hypothetical protein